jgi:hypothetical protein
LQRADPLAYKKRVRQNHLHYSILIGFEDELVLTTTLEKRHRADCLPAFWFAVRACQCRYFNVAIVNRRHCKLSEQGGRFQE